MGSQTNHHLLCVLNIRLDASHLELNTNHSRRHLYKAFAKQHPRVKLQVMDVLQELMLTLPRVVRTQSSAHTETLLISIHYE